MAKFPHTFLLLTWILLSLGGCQSVPSVSTAAQLPLQHAKRNHEAQERLDLKILSAETTDSTSHRGIGVRQWWSTRLCAYWRD